MATVEQQILVRIKAILEGLPQLQVLKETLNQLKSARLSGQIDSDMSRVARAATQLRETIAALELEFSRLKKQTDLGAGFASPAEFARLKELGSLIAEGKKQERDLDQANHLRAVDNIRKQRQEIIKSQQQAATDAAKVEAKDAADFQKRIAERAAARQREQAAVLAQQEATHAKLRASLASIESFSKGIGTTLLAPLKFVGDFVIGIFHQIARQIQFAAAAFAIFVASSPAIGFALLIKEGIEFNSVMEQQRIGLAALIQSTNDIFNTGSKTPNKPLEGIEAYEAATHLAQASTDRLSIKLIPLKATLEDLLPIFNQIVTAGAAAGLTLEQTETVFTELAAAAQVVGIPLEKLGTGIRLLLNGTARATTVLATAIFGSAQVANAWVKEHKKIGDLADALHIKLEAFRLALLTSESSFAVLAENTKDVFQRLAGIATSGLFEKLKASLVEILKSFYDLKTLSIAPEFQALFAFLGDELTRLGAFLLSLTKSVIGYLVDIANYIQNNRVYVEKIVDDLIIIAQSLGLIIVELGQVVADTFQAAKGTGTWADFLEIVARRIGSIHDAINVVIGAFQFLGGEIVSGLLAPLETVLGVLGLISQSAADAADKIAKVREASKDYATRGADRFLSGINEDGRNAVIAEQNARINSERVTVDAGPGTSEDIRLHDLTTSLKTSAIASKAKAGGGRHGGSRGDNKLADSLRELRDSLSNLTQFETRVNRVLFLMDSARKALDRELANHLISIQDFYTKALDIEQTSLDAQAALEERKQERERETSVSKIQALQDKANAARNPNERAAFLNQILAERNKLGGKELESSEKLFEIAGKRKQAEFEIFDARDKALDALQAELRDVRAANLETDPHSRTEDAAKLRIAGQFKTELEAFLINFDSQLGESVKTLIVDIDTLGGVSTEQFLRMAKEGGIAFEDLSQETQDLILHMQRLEIAAKLTAVQARFDRAQRDAAVDIAHVQDELNRGKLTQIEYEKQINALNEKNFATLEDILAQEYQLAKTDEDRLRIKEALEQLKEAHVTVNSLAQDINGSLRTAFKNLSTDLIKDPAHAAAAIKNMAVSMVQDIAGIVVEALVLNRVFKALGISQGSTSGIGGKLSGILGFADGGIISGPGTGTSDSIIARVSTGEAVIPANVVSLNRGLINSLISGSFAQGHMPRYASGFAPGGLVTGGPALPPKVVIALNDDDVANASASSQGEKVWLMHWNNNKRALGY